LGETIYYNGNFEMNFLDGLFILAAGDEGSSYDWIVPVAFVAIWIIGGIGKVIASARENQKQREKQKPASGQPENKMRYKPIPDASTQHQRRERTMPQVVSVPKNKDRDTIPGREKTKPKPKRHGTVETLKKAMHDAMEEAYPKQAKRQSPKPVSARSAKRVQRKATRRTPAPPSKVSKEPARKAQPQLHQESMASGLRERENLRKAIIYSEILGKPLALREC
jgi:hypothetical protein